MIVSHYGTTGCLSPSLPLLDWSSISHAECRHWFLWGHWRAADNNLSRSPRRKTRQDSDINARSLIIWMTVNWLECRSASFTTPDYLFSSLVCVQSLLHPVMLLHWSSATFNTSDWYCVCGDTYDELSDLFVVVLLRWGSLMLTMDWLHFAVLWRRSFWTVTPLLVWCISSQLVKMRSRLGLYRSYIFLCDFQPHCRSVLFSVCAPCRSLAAGE